MNPTIRLEKLQRSLKEANQSDLHKIANSEISKDVKLLNNAVKSIKKKLTEKGFNLFDILAFINSEIKNN